MEKLTKENFDNSIPVIIIDKLNMTEIYDAIDVEMMNRKDISDEKLKECHYRHAMNQGGHEALWEIFQKTMSMLDVDSLRLLYDYETSKIEMMKENGNEWVAKKMKTIRYSIAMEILRRGAMINPQYPNIRVYTPKPRR